MYVTSTGTLKAAKAGTKRPMHRACKRKKAKQTIRGEESVMLNSNRCALNYSSDLSSCESYHERSLLSLSPTVHGALQTIVYYID